MRSLLTGTAILSLLGHLTAAALAPDTAFNQINSLKYNARVDAYLKLPADLRKLYWVGKINHFRQTHQDSLNHTQLDALDIVGSYDKLHLPTTKELMIEEFGFDTAKMVLTTLRDESDDSDIDARTENGKRDNTPSCECSTESDWCNKPKRCIPYNQVPGSCNSWHNGGVGCGTVWDYNCNGMCR